jgi:ABC-2 family transporter
VIALVRVELTRLRWRRAVLALAALGVLVPVVIFVGTVVSTHQKSLAELRQEYGQTIDSEISACQRHPRRYGVDPDGDLANACRERTQANFGNQPLNLRDQRESGSGPAVIALLAMLMLLVGTTFAGHDWNTGSISNQLLFEPRRQRVWLAKLLAVALVAGVLGAAVLFAHWAGLSAVSSARDLDQAPHAVGAAYKQAVLGTALVTGAAVLGFALTTLLRSTVATLGVLFASGFLGIVTVAIGFGGSERFMPCSNFLAFVVGRYTYYVNDSSCFSGDCSPSRHIDRADSVVYFLVILAAVTAASLSTFRSRDLP